ncbi:MAG TPA: CHASE2 domain-containing protein, partial [Thermoleophilaceae bacterium]
MRARQRRTRLALLGVVAVLAVAVPVLLQSVGALDRLELSSVDARLSVRGNHRPSPDVVFVGLDSRTYDAFGQPPIPRSINARVIDRLHQAGARVIAYDLVFQSRKEPREDRALIAAVARARPVVLATYDPDGKPVRVPADYPHPKRIGAVYASIGVPTDADGKVRRFYYAPVQVPSLPVQAAGLFKGKAVPESRFRDNAAWVDFPGPPGTVPTYSLVDVVRGRVPDKAFAGKIVLVGPNDPLERDILDT